MTLSVGKEPLIDLHEDPGHMCDDCGQPDEFCKCGSISTPVLSKPVKILDDVFNIPGNSYGKRWESLSIEEKIGALAEKLDEVIKYLEKNL